MWNLEQRIITERSPAVSLPPTLGGESLTETKGLVETRGNVCQMIPTLYRSLRLTNIWWNLFSVTCLSACFQLCNRAEAGKWRVEKFTVPIFIRCLVNHQPLKHAFRVSHASRFVRRFEDQKGVIKLSDSTSRSPVHVFIILRSEANLCDSRRYKQPQCLPIMVQDVVMKMRRLRKLWIYFGIYPSCGILSNKKKMCNNMDELKTKSVHTVWFSL